MPFLIIIFIMIHSMLSSSILRIIYVIIKGGPDYTVFIFFIVFAFLVKFPIYGVHMWLPKAHVEAPVSGSIVLAGVLLKLGGYGMLRVSFFSVPSTLFNRLTVLTLLGGVILGIICMTHRDIKVVIAYSSVVHMSLIIVGIFSMNSWGLEGGLIIIVSHGICSSGMFIVANVIYERSHSRRYFFNGGGLSVSSFLSKI